ncbi:MAG: lipoate--protein ligase family protein [Candidatus Lokiarchaeota archaeon]|nr:lipoate--protein ligase family protein [Candidatus Lokiarchaeota archaeon]
MSEKNMEWRFLPLETRNGYWNMALDEAILETVIKHEAPSTLRLFKWDPSTVSIGRNQSLSGEVNIEFAKENGFSIVRRITGGGAVFHDNLREITYSIVCPTKFLEKLNAKNVREQFEKIEAGIILALQYYGLEPEQGVIHCPAIFLDGKKFSGNAQVRKKGYILQHGTILLELDPELMYSVLKAPYNVGKAKMVQSVYAKCIGIKDKLEYYNEVDFIKSLKKGFESSLSIKLKDGILTENELNLAEKLALTKYSSSEWLKKYE